MYSDYVQFISTFDLPKEIDWNNALAIQTIFCSKLPLFTLFDTFWLKNVITMIYGLLIKIYELVITTDVRSKQVEMCMLPLSDAISRIGPVSIPDQLPLLHYRKSRFFSIGIFKNPDFWA